MEHEKGEWVKNLDVEPEIVTNEGLGWAFSWSVHQV